MISYADLVESIFGYWPEFADAKIVEFAWSKGGTLRLVIDYIDAQQSKRATVSLLFSGVAEVELTELRSENVLDLLVIGSDDPIEVEIVPCAGVGGTFKCTAVEVTGVVPNHSRRTASPPLNSSVEAVEKPFSDHQCIRRSDGFSFRRHQRSPTIIRRSPTR